MIQTYLVLRVFEIVQKFLPDRTVAKHGRFQLHFKLFARVFRGVPNSISSGSMQ